MLWVACRPTRCGGGWWLCESLRRGLVVVELCCALVVAASVVAIARSAAASQKPAKSGERERCLKSGCRLQPRLTKAIELAICD